MDAYIKNLLETGASRYTVLGYKGDIKHFFSWFRETTGEEPRPEKITAIDLKEYQSFLRARLKPNTVNRRIKALKSWLKWCLRKELIRRLPDFPGGIPQTQTSPQALERSGVNRLLRELEKEGNLRDIAMIRIMLSCGLRISEAVSLKISDMDIGERRGVLTVQRGKGGKRRDVPVPLEARKAIKAWLDMHPGGEWLFPGRDGHLTENAAWRAVKKYAWKAQIPELHPHTLRHTCAKNMLRSGADLATVAGVLGHARLETTAIYTRPSLADMAAALEKSEN